MRHPLYEKLLEQHTEILESLRYGSGLFAASNKGVETGYDKAWLRDNFYEALAFEVIGETDVVVSLYRTILDIFKKHEYKIDAAIAHKPKYTHEYIHPRYNPVTFDEYWEEWGNKQNDSVGCILFKIGEIERKEPGKILLDEQDHRIVQKLVWYLSTLEYWHDEDSGMWEENQEIHASSVGACLAGLKMISHVEGITVPDRLIWHGEEALNKLLPRESKQKFVDLALLSLLWPYNIVTKEQRDEILTNVEYHLVRERGVIRYKGDHYYNKNEDGWSEEAEWTFGLSWLSIIYHKMGNIKKSAEYFKKAFETTTEKGLPELYYSNSSDFNDNTPLGWSESLFIVALHDLYEAHS